MRNNQDVIGELIDLLRRILTGYWTFQQQRIPATMRSNFVRLVEWYSANCNGDWEHQHGFDVATLDNPGLRLRVDLRDTDLIDKAFAPIVHKLESDTGWMHCEKTSDGFFEGCGSPEMIDSVISVFLDWAGEGSNIESSL